MLQSGVSWIRIGISSNASARGRPHPYRLHELERFDYVEYSAPIDYERAIEETSLFAEMVRRRSELPLLFHPVELNLYGPELESEEKLARLSDHLRRVGSPWVSNDVAWWHGGGHLWPGYQYLAPPFTEQGLQDCTAHALHVQRALELPLLLENPAVIAKRGERHVLDFMAELHRRTGCSLLLDLGHLLSFQLTAGLPKESGLDGFPLEAVAEIHIAGGTVASRGERTFYFDAHNQPIREELFELLELVLPRCRSLRAVTYEADGHPEEMAATNLRRLRALVPSEAPPAQAIAPRPASAAASLSAEPWALAKAAYAGPDPWDPDGGEIEREYRLAIMAKEIDPTAGELLAPKLAEFARSPELMEGFAGPGRSIRESFAAWARRRLLAH